MKVKQTVLIAITILTIVIVGVACAPAPTVAPTKAAATSAPAPAATQVTATKPAATTAPAEKTVLRYNLGAQPTSIDPGISGDFNSATMHDQLFLGLFRLNPKTGEAEFELATSQTVSPNGLVWTFKIRNDIAWVKYDPTTKDAKKMRNVTARDIEYAVKRAANPATGAGWVMLLYHVIDKMYEVNKKQPGFTVDNVGVKALDDTTIQFTLEQPAGYFPYILALQTTRPVPKEAIEEFGDKWIDPGNIWTNGPYLLSKTIKGGSFTLEKNPHYYEAAKVQIEQIDLPIITDLATQLAQYETHDLDTISGLPADQIDRVKADAVLGKQLLIMPALRVAKIEFVNTKPPFDDVRVRQAFTAAVDRKTLVEQVTKGGEIPTTRYAPPGIFGAVPTSVKLGQEYDPELAKAKLQEFLKDKNMTIEQFNRTYNLTYGTICGDLNTRIQQAIAAMYKKVLGVDFKLECQESPVYSRTIAKSTPIEQTYHIHRAGWFVDYPDQSNFISWYRWDHENLTRRGCADPICTKSLNTEFDKLIVEADASADPEKRKALYEKAERILFEQEFAWVPLYWGTNVILTKPWLTRDNPPLLRPNLKDWKIDMAARKAAVKK